MEETTMSYDFNRIEVMVRQDIHATSTRFNAALEELAERIKPLQQIWTRESAAAYRNQQMNWNNSASALNGILTRLAAAVGSGAAAVADADRRSSRLWH